MGAAPYLEAALPGIPPAVPPGASVATYVVVGPRPIGPNGATQGQLVDLTLTSDAAAALVDAGHIVLQSNYTPDPPPDPNPVWD